MMYPAAALGIASTELYVGDGRDMREIRTQWNDLGGWGHPERQIMKAKTAVRARILGIPEWWARVGDLADALIEHGYLQGERVHEIVGRPPPQWFLLSRSRQVTQGA
jgi:hypothetical protein